MRRVFAAIDKIFPKRGFCLNSRRNRRQLIPINQFGGTLQKRLWGLVLFLLLVGVVATGHFFRSSAPLPNSTKNKLSAASDVVPENKAVTGILSHVKSTAPLQNENIEEARTPSGRQPRLGLNENVKITTPELPAQIANGRGWFLADELRARRREKFNDQGVVVERRGSIVIYKIDTQANVADADEMQVLYRPARRQIAVLYGRLNVQLKDMDQAEVLAQKYPLTIEDQKPSIQYVFIRPAAGVDLFSLANSLAQEEQVRSVQLETVHLDLVHK